MIPKIALIEDNADNRLLLEALLADDYEVDEYEDGVEGLESMVESPPALVLLDISLPDMNGTEVLTRMRADPRLAKIPVIALTAHVMPGGRESFLDQGFDDYVNKPIVDERVLFDAIARLLSDSEAR